MEIELIFFSKLKRLIKRKKYFGEDVEKVDDSY